MSRVAAFGELLLRLKSPGHERLFQSPNLEATFGGAEANVAVTLAAFGVSSSMISAVPPGPIGDACIGELRRFGVETSHIARQGERLGIYYLEAGSSQRPSTVVYDRASSSLATARADDFDWDAVLDGVDWFHITGITPAISASAADLALQATRQAREKGLQVSCDYNYRGNLWKYGRAAPDVMRELVKHVTVGVAGREDCQKMLGIDLWPDAGSKELEPERYEALARAVLDEFPNLEMQVITLRESKSADANSWRACLHDRNAFLVSRGYDIEPIVDRVGAGDAFTGGLIYGLLTHGDRARALEFATAASCLKHTIPGDFNRVTVAEVEGLIRDGGSGRVQR